MLASNPARVFDTIIDVTCLNQNYERVAVLSHTESLKRKAKQSKKKNKSKLNKLHNTNNIVITHSLNIFS